MKEIKMFLKSLYLKNYGPYEEHNFDFTKEDGSPYKFICFFGPNGSGKTSCLEVIKMLTANLTGLPEDRVYEKMRKHVRNPDYVGGIYDKNNTSYKTVGGTRYVVHDIDTDDITEMIIRGVFSDGKNDYIVELNQRGFTCNDLAPIKAATEDDEFGISSRVSVSGPFGENHLKFRERLIHTIKTDSDLSLNKFRLRIDHSVDFERIIEAITGFATECIAPSGFVESELDYVTDYIITKKDLRIHYKRMSTGERKIGKSFSDTLNLIYELAHPAPRELQMKGLPSILLIDNIVMHVYYNRHIQMLDCLKQVFNDQQIFSTTHSGTLITRYLENKHDQDNELWCDLEPINVFSDYSSSKSPK